MSVLGSSVGNAKRVNHVCNKLSNVCASACSVCVLGNRQAYLQGLKQTVRVSTLEWRPKENEAMNSNQMRVILGVSSLKAYVASPKSFHVLGIVRFGMEYGLLATDADGLYFRVNGSQIIALDTVEVRRAIDYSYGTGGRFAASAAAYAATHPNAQPLPGAAPKISVRKHRQVQNCDLNSGHATRAANA
jgi:hypothetical protein